jgi:hypothetical protein
MKLHTMADVDTYMKDGTKRYGGKNKFLASDEYREAYPRIAKIHEQASKTWVTEKQSQAKEAMEAAGVSFGDRVSTGSMGLFGFHTFTGTVYKDKNGLPKVKLDTPQNGKKTVQWNRAWLPTANALGDNGK